MEFFSNFFKKSELKTESDNKFSIDNTINVLSSELKSPTKWNVTPNIGGPDSELFDLWHQIQGGHRWHHYFPIYEKIFKDFRNKPIKILEIGVARGASLQMWHNYFADAVIVGVDIQPACQEAEDVSNKIFVRIGSQENISFLGDIISEFGKFDIIIDDGSHVTSHMIDSFNYLFLNGLNSDGIYAVEDTHSNYWVSHRDSAKSFMDLAKSMVDMMHYHYTLFNQEINFRVHSPERILQFEVPKITTMIEEIRFFDSIVVIYRKDDRNIPTSEYI